MGGRFHRNAHLADEDSEAFQQALLTALKDDEEYKTATMDISNQDEDASEKLRLAERDLRDRIRIKLGLGERQTDSNISLKQHAINHQIRPSFDLPKPGDIHEDGRHDDKKIQLFMLPDEFERKLNALYTKCNSWIQETGINVFHAAFGLLEWTDPISKESAVSSPYSLACLFGKGTQTWIEFSCFRLW
jgi:hypothetical protein